MTTEIKTVKLSDIHEYDGNPRQIKKEDFEKLKKSLKEFPEMLEIREIVIDETGAILGGNQRYKALLANGETETTVKQVTGWSENQKREFVIKDNIANGDWDTDILVNQWDDLPLDDWGIGIELDEEQDEYDAFVDKFKPKLTTDDCYTPPEIVEAVEKWVRKEYKITQENIRPFKPGGDYQSEDYTGKVVIDNPPFSIITEICRWFCQHNIKFFLYAPHLTLFGIAPELEICKVITGANLTYENGAVVNTSFVTNMEEQKNAIFCSASLRDAIEEAQPNNARQLEKYKRPKNCKMASDFHYVVKAGHDIKFERSKVQHIKNLEELKNAKKGLFGSGFLVTDTVAEKLAAEKLAAEKLAAEKLAAEKLATVVHLSKEESKIVDELNNREKMNGKA